MSALAAGLFALAAVAVLAVASICDVRAHVIPYELSLSLYPIAAGYQLFANGWVGLLVSAAIVLICLGVFLLASRIYEAWRHRDPVGMGDMRTIPAVAMLSGTDGIALGLAACCLSMAAVVGIGMARGKADMKTSVAMCPYLAVWALVALAAQSF